MLDNEAIKQWEKERKYHTKKQIGGVIWCRLNRPDTGEKYYNGIAAPYNLNKEDRRTYQNRLFKYICNNRSYDKDIEDYLVIVHVITKEKFEQLNNDAHNFVKKELLIEE